MIARIEMFRAYCDECGCPHYVVAFDKMQVESQARASGWHVDDWRTVCPECHKEAE